MKTDPFEGYVDAEVIEIIKSDDKERFVPLLSAHAQTVKSTNVVRMCAAYHAKKCLLAMIQGEAGVTPNQLYAREAAQYSAKPTPTPTPRPTPTPTPLAYVAYYFPEADDIIDLLLQQGPADHANMKCELYEFTYDPRIACPLDRALWSLSSKPHLLPWSSGDSLIKLIILLCQWESRPSLNCARLLAPHTDGFNDIALSYVKQGKLASFAALLLVAQEKVLVPFDSGLTIRQRIIEMVQKLNSKKGDLDYEEALFQSMLIEVYKLLDIFEKAGAALSLYCSSMHEYVPPHKVLTDVASVLKKAGYALEPIDLDLRDCYRDCAEVKNASLFKLSDPESQDKKYCLPSSLTRAQGFGATRHSYSYPGMCLLFHKLKSGQLLSMKNPSASEPRLFSTAAGQVDNGGSGISWKHLAFITRRFKRGIKF